MKQIVPALLCLFLLCGCAGQRNGMDTGYYGLYFVERELKNAAGEGALRRVSSGIPAVSDAGPAETAETLLYALLSGPESEDLRGTIPDGTKLLSLDLRGSRAMVDFSENYSSLSGVSLTLADYAVTLTLTQIPEISMVQITVEGQPLAYRGKQSLTARDVQLQPDGDVVGTAAARLYFPNSAGELSAEERTLSLYEGDTQVEVTAQAVEGGPENRELSPAFPEGFRVRAVWLEEDICFVNLSSALLETVAPDSLSLALEALDLSLCSLENVREVRYLVDGEFWRDYNGVSLSEPYGPAGE